MEIILEGVRKRFGRNTVLKDIDLHIRSGEHLAILGANGSGKSTLMKILSSFSTPSKGKVSFLRDGDELPIDEVPRRVYHLAPSIELYTEMDLEGTTRFHFSLREWHIGWDEERLLNYLGLPRQRSLSTYSSGMLQRVRIALAWATAGDLLLFDEVSMNLDKAGLDWFQAGLRDFCDGRTVIFASNQAEAETGSCQRRFRLENGQLQAC